VATAPNQRWATDMCRIWAGRDGWTVLALVIDCHTRDLLGWHLSRSGKAKTAEAALEQALIARCGILGKVTAPFLLRSDNGLVFTSRSYTKLVRSYGLRQEFITPHCPEQNGMVERVIRTLKKQCVHRHRFESLQNASRVIADLNGFYNNQRPHQALGGGERIYISEEGKVMAYHMFIPKGGSENEMLLDLYLGSAYTIALYWTSIGHKLHLPIVSSLIDRAESEYGCVLSGRELIEFKEELVSFGQFWEKEALISGAPEYLLENVRKATIAIDEAVKFGDSLYFG
jgi:hypothetical protein